MNELSLNVIFPKYVNDDETSDTGREIIKAHIGVCGLLVPFTLLLIVPSLAPLLVSLYK